jgi:CheY-like chemotaxis protein
VMRDQTPLVSGLHPISSGVLRCFTTYTSPKFLIPVRHEIPARSNSASRPLCLVDDDEVDQMLFCRLLREANIAHPCRTFSRGEELIDALIEVLRGAALPLACFLDVRMPGMNGFDVLRWIRCQQPLNDVAVVMLSSSDELRDLQEANHFGAQCYLSKFPTAAQLVEIVLEAERAAEASNGHAFKLPCNLLVGAPQVLI